ncbi:MAG: hypothetical protein ACREWG_11950 [Gammaproteobacteria bacterium]
MLGPAWAQPALRGNDIALALDVGELDLPGAFKLHGLRFYCRALVLDLPNFRCRGALVGMNDPGGGGLSLHGDLDYRRNPIASAVSLERLRVLGGSGYATARRQEGDWQANVRLTGIEPGLLVPWLAKHSGVTLDLSDFSGTLDLRATGEGLFGQLRRGRLTLTARALGFNGSSALQALSGSLEARFDPAPGGDWRIAAESRLRAGDLYVEPDLGPAANRPGFALPAGGLTLVLEARWRTQSRHLEVTRLRFSDARVASIIGRLSWSAAQPRGLVETDLVLRFPNLHRAFPRYLKPLLIDTPFSDLEAAGGLEMAIRWDTGGLRKLHLHFNNVSLKDSGQRLRVLGLRGAVKWTNGGQPIHSTVGWREALWARLPIGAALLRLESRSGELRVRHASPIPILGGKLLIESMGIGATEQPRALQLDARLTPLSLADLARAFAWRPMSGRVSAVLPGLVFSGGNLLVGGTILIQAFGGMLVIQELRIEDPLGSLPLLSADLLLRDLDLDALTSTFSFGRIQGRLGGQVRGLRLEDWSPVAFDAEIMTPRDDESRHRISQRALRSITSLGGGGIVQGVSRALFAVFDEFAYRRLGVRCRLRKGACEMDGVAKAGEGYYLVQGGWVPPRVEVIGHQRRVDWAVLLERLRRVLGSEAAAVVE